MKKQQLYTTTLFKIVITGDTKNDSSMISGTRVFARRFVKALKQIAEEENLMVYFPRSGNRHKFIQALNLLKHGLHSSVIHCLTGGKDVELAYVLSKLYRTKLVISVHGHPAQLEKYGLGVPWLTNVRIRYVYNFIIKRADAVIFPSETLQKLVLEKVNLDPNKVYIIPPGVEEEFILQNPRKTPTSKQIGIFAKWAKIKGVDRLPNILIAAEKLGLTVRWIGVNPDQIQILKNNQSLSLEPPSSLEEQPRLLDECLIVMVPSLTESFSQVALEAMARGVPVVVSEDVGIASLVRTYRAGEVVNFSEVNMLIESIKKIMKDYENYSKNALLCALDHTWQKIIRKYLAIYRTISE
jgi:glycosyltransferase involved in cell wall biosynthesis